MAGRRTRTALAASLALALIGLLATAGPAEAAKKKAKTGPFSQMKAVNAAIPEGPAAGNRATPLVSTITVPKKYKGKVVGDVNVTGIQTTGSGAGAGNHLGASLSAPNGRTIDLFVGIGGVALQSIGPWTIDDDTSVSICNQTSAIPCTDATRTLYPPFAGTSNTIFNFSGGFPPNGPLASFYRVPMNGTWTFRIFDLTNTGALTSTLNQWGLRVTPAKPVKG